MTPMAIFGLHDGFFSGSKRGLILRRIVDQALASIDIGACWRRLAFASGTGLSLQRAHNQCSICTPRESRLRTWGRFPRSVSKSVAVFFGSASSFA